MNLYGYLRLLSSVLLLIPLWLPTYWAPIVMALILLVTDSIDSIGCKYVYNNQCECDKEYQKMDKIIDLVHYAVAIAVLSFIIKRGWLLVLLGLFLWRCIGVLIWIRGGQKSKKVFVVFPDVVKEVMLLTALPINEFWPYAVVFILLKILFEIGRMVYATICN